MYKKTLSLLLSFALFSQLHGMQQQAITASTETTSTESGVVIEFINDAISLNTNLPRLETLLKKHNWLSSAENSMELTLLTVAYIHRRPAHATLLMEYGADIYNERLQKNMLKDLQAGFVEKNETLALCSAAHIQNKARTIANIAPQIAQNTLIILPLAQLCAEYAAPVFCTELSPQEVAAVLAPSAKPGDPVGDFVDEY